jgi:hypothetical protein
MIGSHDSGKAAFEVGKGPLKISVLSEAQVVRFLDPNELLRELETSFGALAGAKCNARRGPGSRCRTADSLSPWPPGSRACRFA